MDKVPGILFLLLDRNMAEGKLRVLGAAVRRSVA